MVAGPLVAKQVIGLPLLSVPQTLPTMWSDASVMSLREVTPLRTTVYVPETVLLPVVSRHKDSAWPKPPQVPVVKLVPELRETPEAPLKLPEKPTVGPPSRTETPDESVKTAQISPVGAEQPDAPLERKSTVATCVLPTKRSSEVAEAAGAMAKHSIATRAKRESLGLICTIAPF
jgi:hypothetical protein